ncbi:hypothetical protein BDY21DRAFT_336400 [Lineolata rhizophorae]|uniref:Uncharacterized protein n=1 Tax=Lineolata rhizophorae TaxID=578093 RepID=A0A6A6P7A6_9PEZI|nr:hypothetical protein BDY21DRAFT_336400 [Lineolata rhizophorae]
MGPDDEMLIPAFNATTAGNRTLLRAEVGGDEACAYRWVAVRENRTCSEPERWAVKWMERKPCIFSLLARVAFFSPPVLLTRCSKLLQSCLATLMSLLSMPASISRLYSHSNGIIVRVPYNVYMHSILEQTCRAFEGVLICIWLASLEWEA